MRHGSGLEESWALVTVSECDDDREIEKLLSWWPGSNQ